jgi:hypothetical protein
MAPCDCCGRLARVLVAERLASQVITTYSEQLIASLAKLQALQRQLKQPPTRAGAALNLLIDAA